MTTYAGVVVGGAERQGGRRGEPRGEPDLHPGGPHRRSEDAAQRPQDPPARDRRAPPLDRGRLDREDGRLPISGRDSPGRGPRRRAGRPEFSPHASAISALAVSPDGRRLRRSRDTARSSSSTWPGGRSLARCRSPKATSLPSNFPGTDRLSSPPAGSGPSRACGPVPDQGLGPSLDGGRRGRRRPGRRPRPRRDSGRARRAAPGREGPRLSAGERPAFLPKADRLGHGRRLQPRRPARRRGRSLRRPLPLGSPLGSGIPHTPRAPQGDHLDGLERQGRPTLDGRRRWRNPGLRPATGRQGDKPLGRPRRRGALDRSSTLGPDRLERRGIVGSRSGNSTASPSSDLGPAPDQTTRVAWTADGRSVVSGDLSGEVRIWSLLDCRRASCRCRLPPGPRPSRWSPRC